MAISECSRISLCTQPLAFGSARPYPTSLFKSPLPPYLMHAHFLSLDVCTFPSWALSLSTVRLFKVAFRSFTFSELPAQLSFPCVKFTSVATLAGPSAW